MKKNHTQHPKNKPDLFHLLFKTSILCHYSSGYLTSESLSVKRRNRKLGLSTSKCQLDTVFTPAFQPHQQLILIYAFVFWLSANIIFLCLGCMKNKMEISAFIPLMVRTFLTTMYSVICSTEVNLA